MKIKVLIILIIFSSSLFAGEALRYAMHGCIKKKNPKACKIVEALSGKKIDPKTGKVVGRSIASTSDVEVSIHERGGNAKMAKLMVGCKEYAQKIRTCTPYFCTYRHPMFPDQKMVKKIVGREAGFCKTEEQMPNNGLMTCLFTDDKLKRVAEFTKSLGQKHKNIMQQWSNDGTCEISGYGQ